MGLQYLSRSHLPLPAKRWRELYDSEKYSLVKRTPIHGQNVVVETTWLGVYLPSYEVEPRIFMVCTRRTTPKRDQLGVIENAHFLKHEWDALALHAQLVEELKEQCCGR